MPLIRPKAGRLVSGTAYFPDSRSSRRRCRADGLHELGFHRPDLRLNLRDAKRYGYIYVDQDDEGGGTLARQLKKSFYWYKQVIATNGAELQNL